MRYYGIHLRAISQETLKISILHMSLKITNYRLLPNLPGISQAVIIHCKLIEVFLLKILSHVLFKYFKKINKHQYFLLIFLFMILCLKCLTDIERVAPMNTTTRLIDSRGLEIITPFYFDPHKRITARKFGLTRGCWQFMNPGTASW